MNRVACKSCKHILRTTCLRHCQPCSEWCSRLAVSAVRSSRRCIVPLVDCGHAWTYNSHTLRITKAAQHPFSHRVRLLRPGILKVENLSLLKALRVLKLDNNSVSRIEGLEALTMLEELGKKRP
jgi:hypothetical protein